MDSLAFLSCYFYTQSMHQRCITRLHHTSTLALFHSSSWLFCCPREKASTPTGATGGLG